MHHMPQEHPDSTASALTAITASYEGGGLRARSGSAQARCTCCHFCSCRLAHLNLQRALRKLAWQWAPGRTPAV